MDPWLTDEIKELLFSPCLNLSGIIGRKLDNRIRMAQEIDERALTETLVDALDTSSKENVWGQVLHMLRDHQIYLNTSIHKSSREHLTGADIGFIINRHVYQRNNSSRARYAALVQCKRIDNNGNVVDFFHEVRSTGKKQSSLMLDITPSSFYFIFTPPSLIKTYCSIEPIAFLISGDRCSSPVWNFGHFGFDNSSVPFLTSEQKAQSVGLMVVPALAVEAQNTPNKQATLNDILPNSVPFWYWFGILLMSGIIGDYRADTIDIASNVSGRKNIDPNDFGVRYSVDISFGNG